MVSLWNIEDLVAPGVLSDVEVSRSTGHVVGHDVVEVVIVREGLLVALCFGVVVSQVDWLTILDFPVNGKNPKVGAVLVHCVGEKVQSDVIKGSHCGRRKQIDIDAGQCRSVADWRSV